MSEIRYASILYLDRLPCTQGSEDDKGPTLDVVRYHGCLCMGRRCFDAFDRDRMIMSDFDGYPDALEEIYEIHDMWFDRCELYFRFSTAKCSCHDDILSSGHSKSSRYLNIFLVIVSFKTDHLIGSSISVSKC